MIAGVFCIRRRVEEPSTLPAWGDCHGLLEDLRKKNNFGKEITVPGTCGPEPSKKPAGRPTGFFSGESGIRTHAPRKDDRISSAARYDHFDISP